MPAYHEAFRVGENVRIANKAMLRAFQDTWTYHHPLTDEQVVYADKRCYVRRVTFYHGGDCLYELGHFVRDADQPPDTPYPRSHEEALPGYWHEACLRDDCYDTWEAQLPLACDVYKVSAEERQGQPVVVVQTTILQNHTTIDCLVARRRNHEQEARVMNQVAWMRNALAFERRYDFEGVIEDARRARYTAPSADEKTS